MSTSGRIEKHTKSSAQIAIGLKDSRPMKSPGHQANNICDGKVKRAAPGKQSKGERASKKNIVTLALKGIYKDRTPKPGTIGQWALLVQITNGHGMSGSYICNAGAVMEQGRGCKFSLDSTSSKKLGKRLSQNLITIGERLIQSKIGKK